MSKLIYFLLFFVAYVAAQDADDPPPSHVDDSPPASDGFPEPQSDGGGDVYVQESPQTGAFAQKLMLWPCTLACSM